VEKPTRDRLADSRPSNACAGTGSWGGDRFSRTAGPDMGPT